MWHMGVSEAHSQIGSRKMAFLGDHSEEPHVGCVLLSRLRKMDPKDCGLLQRLTQIPGKKLEPLMKEA